MNKLIIDEESDAFIVELHELCTDDTIIDKFVNYPYSPSKVDIFIKIPYSFDMDLFVLTFEDVIQIKVLLDTEILNGGELNENPARPDNYWVELTKPESKKVFLFLLPQIIEYIDNIDPAMLIDDNYHY